MMLAMAIETPPALGVLFAAWFFGSYMLPMLPMLPMLLTVFVVVVRPGWPGALATTLLSFGLLNVAPLLLVGLFFMAALGPIAWIIGLLLVTAHLRAWSFATTRLMNPLPSRSKKDRCSQTSRTRKRHRGAAFGRESHPRLTLTTTPSSTWKFKRSGRKSNRTVWFTPSIRVTRHGFSLLSASCPASSTVNEM